MPSILDKTRDVFDRLFGAPKPAPVVTEPPAPEPTPAPVAAPQDDEDGYDTEASNPIVEDAFNRGVCFYCGIWAWQDGPRGGASQNFRCGCCGQKINALVINHKALFSQRIGVDPELRALYKADPEGRRKKIKAEVAAQVN